MNNQADQRNRGALPRLPFISLPPGKRGESKKMRYKRTFQIFQTIEQAQAFIKSRKGRKTTLTPWSSSDGKENGFLVWYYI